MIIIIEIVILVVLLLVTCVSEILASLLAYHYIGVALASLYINFFFEKKTIF